MKLCERSTKFTATHYSLNGEPVEKIPFGPDTGFWGSVIEHHLGYIMDTFGPSEEAHVHNFHKMAKRIVQEDMEHRRSLGKPIKNDLQYVEFFRNYPHHTSMGVVYIPMIATPDWGNATIDLIPDYDNNEEWSEYEESQEKTFDDYEREIEEMNPRWLRDDPEGVK